MNPYEVLGVPRDADAATIRRAWRKEAKRWHPDTCKAPDAERRFGAARDAFDLLSSPERRAAFDRGEDDTDTPSRVFESGLEGVFQRVVNRPPTEREATGLRILSFTARLLAAHLKGSP